VQIYIDESGSFVTPLRPNRVSAVGALVIPDSQADELLAAFEALTRPWTANGGEVKGSSLTEVQIAGVIELVGQYHCLFDVRGIDMGLHDRARIEAFQDRQAAAVTRHITTAHHEGWRKWGAMTEKRMRGLSPQLFTQGMLTIYLVMEVLQAATLYYAQRLPAELGRFRWRVDPKDQTRRTELELLWTDVILPIAQTGSMTEPFAMFEGCDYSHFARFYIDREAMPPDLARYVIDSPRDGGLDFGAILADVSFPESRTETGLRLVDILLSAFCRAVNGTLDQRGWAMLGRLMTITRHNRGRLVYLRLDPGEPVPGGPQPYDSTLYAIERETRDILTRERRAQQDD
jgi:hypothetical protein